MTGVQTCALPIWTAKRGGDRVRIRGSRLGGAEETIALERRRAGCAFPCCGYNSVSDTGTPQVVAFFEVYIPVVWMDK